ncbi:hypothetical protein C1646_820847 [Rhizophagus diaphanus]|nr:hypothetical protein C1646_820847 [Rhizophagus diaphanus] [Rhizophagus sp. MUCL 43196]
MYFSGSLINSHLLEIKLPTREEVQYFEEKYQKILIVDEADIENADVEEYSESKQNEVAKESFQSFNLENINSLPTITEQEFIHTRSSILTPKSR